MRHHGISLWRDIFEPEHFVLVLLGRWMFHIYGWDRPYKRHFYWVPIPSWWTHLNEDDEEFERLPF